MRTIFSPLADAIFTLPIEGVVFMTCIDAGDRRLLTVGPFELTAANARAIAARSPQSPSIRAVVDALRRDPDAFSGPMAAVRRAAIAAATAPVSLKQISAAFAALPSPRRLSHEDLLPGLPRLRAGDANLIEFPLRQLSAPRNSSAIDVARPAGARGAKPFDAAAAKQDLAERRAESLDDALSAAARLASGAGDLVVDARPGDGRLDDLANRLGWAIIGIIRANAGRPLAPAENADGDKLVPIGIAAQILGLTKNAVVKRARKMGFVELVGGRIHIRRRLIGKLYAKRAELASAQA